MSKYYAVRKGKKIGVFYSWAECQEQVSGFSGAEYKSFKSLEEAEKYLGMDGSHVACADSSNIDFSKIPVVSEKTEDYKIEKALEERKNHAISYVDGSYNEKLKAYGYGVVFFYKDFICTFSEPFIDKYSEHRNVAGEVQGALKAMEFAIANHCKSLDLYYDYTGIYHWAVGDWKRNNDFTKSYYKKAQEYFKKLEVTFYKVEAHSGNKYNEKADQLAKEAVGN